MTKSQIFELINVHATENRWLYYCNKNQVVYETKEAMDPMRLVRIVRLQFIGITYGFHIGEQVWHRFSRREFLPTWKVIVRSIRNREI